MYRKQQYFIFDLDGTLAYTLEDLTDALNLTFENYGFPHVSVNDTLRNINSGSVMLVRKSLPPDRQNDELFVKEVHEHYIGNYSQIYMNKTHLYPCIPEGIAYLKSHGAKLAVFSNKGDEQTKALIDKFFPKNTFEIALGYSGRFPHKPSPEGALYIASEFFCAEPSEIVLVGDSDIDMTLAVNSGMHPVGVGWGYRPKELLESLGAEMILCGENDFHKLI